MEYSEQFQAERGGCALHRQSIIPAEKFTYCCLPLPPAFDLPFLPFPCLPFPPGELEFWPCLYPLLSLAVHSGLSVPELMSGSPRWTNRYHGEMRAPGHAASAKS